MEKTGTSNKYLKILAYSLEFLALLILLYLVFLPIYPNVVYRFKIEPQAKQKARDIEYVKKASQDFSGNTFPGSDWTVSENRVIIPKIGVNAPIVESNSAEYGLSLGAWHVPESSTPDQGGNTVITGHRFRYLPPNNLTFYLFHKLEAGDIFKVIWKEKDYYYKIREIRIVDDTEVSILDNTREPVLTMFTCHPIYSTEKRLVVVSDLLEVE